MKTNIINWFKVENWLDLSFNYKLVDVSIEGGGNNKAEINKAFFGAISFLSSETKGVVSVAYNNGKRFIAIKADAKLEKKTISGTPFDIILTPLEGLLTLQPKTMDKENLDLAVRFLESSIEFQLGKNYNLWSGGPNTFLNKAPLPQSREIQTDIYHGFKFKVVAPDRHNVFVCIDLAYKYVSRQTLHELLKSCPQERANEIINGKNYLYQNGDDWYTVKGKFVGPDITKQPIEIDSFKGTVFDYIKSHGKYSGAKNKQPLIADSPTFFHSYSNYSTRSVAGAACLAKAIHFADNGLHRLSINDPDKRFMRAELHASKYFQRLSFNGTGLRVSTKPHLMPCDVFDIPPLKFGKGQVLDPYEGNVKYGSPLQHFPKRRREYIYRYGVIDENAFTPQYLFVPDNMPYNLAKSLKFHFDRSIKHIAPEFPGFIIHAYPMRSFPYASNVCRDLKALIAAKKLEGGNALFVLPESGDNGRFNRYLHDLIKKELFFEVKIKCISTKSLRRYLKPVVDRFGQQTYEAPDEAMRDFRSYQMNTIFEHLIINRRWPYSLAENLHHDLYIGIDAHDFFAGFVFFFKNGEKVVFDIEKVAKTTGSFRNEKINFKVIQDKIVTVLGRHLKYGGEVPKSMVILRDGVSYGEEEKALLGALVDLTNKGLLDMDNIQTGVVDIAKSSALPVRAATFVGHNKNLENPDCGTHFYLDRRNAFIFNTGFPYRVPGSSNPIQVTLSSGNIDFEKALEDVFRLTQITFSSPDRPTSLPLPLKLIDTLIRDVAHEYDYANTQEKELKIIENSLN